MTEHEKLKTVCDDIGYEIDRGNNMVVLRGKTLYDYQYERVLDVREVIFTPEFMDKFIEYGLNVGNYDGYEAYREIWKYLKDPTEYIYNLLELGKQ